MIDSLRVLLVAIGINNGSDYAVTGTWAADIVAAYLNLQMILEDHSHGIHNPAYVRAVLTNTIEAMEPLAP